MKVSVGSVVAVDNLLPGTYTAALEAYAGGGVAYFGQTSGINITQGMTTTANITIGSFVSTVTPVVRPARKTFTVNYASVANATSYEVEAASDAGFTLNRVTVAATLTTAQVTAPTYATYYVRVRAIDPFTALGQPSPAVSIPVTGALYIINDAKDSLQVLDPGSLAITNVGPLGVVYDFGDCAWNPVDNTLYAVDGRNSNSLYRVNLNTGAATTIGVHGLTDMFALGYHPPTTAVYGLALVTGNRQLYRMNLTTGVATLIGVAGALQLEGLVWDAPRSQFVAMRAGVEQFYTINVATGAATLLGGSGASINDLGMTYDVALDKFWAVDYSGNIFRYDPITYARTSLAAGQGTHSCIAYVP